MEVFEPPLLQETAFSARPIPKLGMSQEYDTLGRLERIVSQYMEEDGTVCVEMEPAVRYQRPQKKETISALARNIEQMLLEQIPAAVASAKKSDGPFYCLLMYYCGDDFSAGWPPSLVLGREAWRKQVIHTGRDVPYFLWGGMQAEDEACTLLDLSDQGLNAACELQTQLMAVKGNYSAARKVLQNVAKALNDYDWAKLIPVTSDFLVAAVDDHGETDPVKDIKSVLSPAAFQSLQQRGLL